MGPPEKTIVIYKRFSDFYRLHHSIGGEFHVQPPRKSIFRYWQRFDEWFVERRQVSSSSNSSPP